MEPGPTRTNFGAGLISPPSMAVYDLTPSGEARRAIAAGSFAVNGDAAKVAQDVIDSVGVAPAPRRLLTGSDAYERVHQASAGRLTALEAQKETACNADVDR